MTLSFVTTIDDMFSSSLPAEVRENAKNLNKKKILKIPMDHNSWKLVFTRIKLIFKQNMGHFDRETLKWKQKKNKNSFFYELANIFVNIWCTLLINF